jgi:hypothetical protein
VPNCSAFRKWNPTGRIILPSGNQKRFERDLSQSIGVMRTAFVIDTVMMILIRIPALVWGISCVVALFLQDWRCVIFVLVFLPITVLYEREFEKRRQS